MEQAIYNTNDVIAACLILGDKDQDRQEIKRAEKYLLEFQKAPQSWTISCDIMAAENLHHNVYAQVAIFLKQKFRYDFYQLPSTEYWNIAQLLIRFLMQHFNASITSQLSLALVLLYMHAFESMGDLIDILGQTLFTIDKKAGLALDIIQLIPEVALDKEVIVSNKQRDAFIAYLKSHLTQKVFDILNNLGKNEGLEPTIKYKILDAFQEWFYFARRSEKLIQNIHEHSCFALALASMNDSLLAEKARCGINHIIRTVKRPEEHPKIFEAIFRYIFEYMNECNDAIKNDPDLAVEYTKVFRAFGIRFSRNMIVQPNESLMKFLQYMIELTANKKLSIDGLVELDEFWEEFSNDFVKILKTNQYPGKLNEFAEVFKLLIQITVTRFQMNEEELLEVEKRAKRKNYYEDKEDGHNDDDDEDTVDQDLGGIEEKQDERRYCRRILNNVQDIIGFPDTFASVFETLRELMTKVQENNIDWGNMGWDLIGKFECIMYAAKSCIIDIHSKERPDLSAFFELIMKVNLKSVKANRTKIELIEYAAEMGTVNEEIMSSMFSYLAECLVDPITGDDAGIALGNLCEHCSGFVIKNFESFLQLRDRFEKNDDLVIALAVAIAHDQETQARERYLAQLCMPFAERIVKNIELWDSDPSEDVEYHIKSNLRKLEMIFERMPIIDRDDDAERIHHPLEPVLQELWPIFKNALRKFAGRTRILVNLSNVIKKCIRALDVKFKRFIIEYFEVICEIFTINPLPDFLYAIEVSASVFGKEADMIEPLTKVYEYVSSATLTYISDKDMKDHSELIEDFFGMLYRYIKYLPRVILYSNTLEINLHLAELAIGVDQPNIEKTLFLFLEVLFKLCSYNPEDEIEKAVTEIIVNKYGAIYIKKLISEFATYPQQRLREYIKDIVFGSFVQLKGHTLQWLEASLVQVPETILTPVDKQDLLKALDKIDVTKPKPHGDDEDEEWEVKEDYDAQWEFFEFRCKLVERRKHNFEKVL